MRSPGSAVRASPFGSIKMRYQYVRLMADFFTTAMYPFRIMSGSGWRLARRQACGTWHLTSRFCAAVAEDLATALVFYRKSCDIGSKAASRTFLKGGF
jgi:hypothetical protein